MKHILIPTDFSENAWNAIKYGIQLFKKTTCTFYLMHVDSAMSYAGGDIGMFAPPELVEETLTKRSTEQLQKILKKIERLPLNSKHRFVVKTAHTFFIDSLRKAIADYQIDLVIMGTKGATGLKEVTVGSNTGDVMTKVKCALLAVPENAEFKKPKEIAFPTDYQTGYDPKVLSGLVEMAIMTKASISVLNVAKRGEELSAGQQRNQEFLNDYLKNVDHSFHTITGDEIESSLQCFVQSREIGMIAMVAKNLNFLQRLLFRPLVEKISYHADIPFLILHEL